jgi:hypothetical protein
MRKLRLAAAEDLPELIMRRHERASALVTSNRTMEDRDKLLSGVAVVSTMLDDLLLPRRLPEVRPEEVAQQNGLGRRGQAG